MRHAAVSLIAAMLLTGTTAAAPTPAPPGALAFRLGALHLTALRDANNTVANDGSVFGIGVPPTDVAAVLAHAGAPGDRIALGVDALLVALPGRLVLIDTGLGPHAGSGLARSLAEARVSAQSITDILVTHTHPDHVGGLLAADGTLAFPNAAIRLSAPEWASFRGKGDKALVAAIAPKVQPFAPGAMVLPGIRAVALPGHTPGHSGYEIVSGADRLLDIGDTAHSAIVSLARPDWTIGYDGDAAAGRATREAELATLARSHERVFAPHFPFPGIGFVVRSGNGYRFVPAVP